MGSSSRMPPTTTMAGAIWIPQAAEPPQQQREMVTRKEHAAVMKKSGDPPAAQLPGQQADQQVGDEAPSRTPPGRRRARRRTTAANTPKATVTIQRGNGLGLRMISSSRRDGLLAAHAAGHDVRHQLVHLGQAGVVVGPGPDHAQQRDGRLVLGGVVDGHRLVGDVHLDVLQAQRGGDGDDAGLHFEGAGAVPEHGFGQVQGEVDGLAGGGIHAADLDRRVGAGGTLGLQQLAKSAPDGDTLGVGATGALLLNPNLPSNPGPDLLRELAPVAKLIDVAIVLVANPATGPKTIREMIERSKATPGGLAYGSTGTNTSQHLSVELLRQATGANLVHVPYRGSAPAVVDLLAGQIPLGVGGPDLRLSPHPGRPPDRARPCDSKRFPVTPEIPTIAEGGVPGFGRASGFIGLFAPAGTPAPVIKKLSREVAAILATPGAQTTARALTSATAYEDDETFARFLTAESTKWKQALSSLNLSNPFTFFELARPKATKSVCSPPPCGATRGEGADPPSLPPRETTLHSDKIPSTKTGDSHALDAWW